ncbi:MAG: hypothetical protein M3Z66_04765 [Chloroflexota bacterium]|nr:hypothetical protein [Chloroflexota bacterium]
MNTNLTASPAKLSAETVENMVEAGIHELDRLYRAREIGDAEYQDQFAKLNEWADEAAVQHHTNPELGELLTNPERCCQRAVSMACLSTTDPPLPKSTLLPNRFNPNISVAVRVDVNLRVRLLQPNPVETRTAGVARAV